MQMKDHIPESEILPQAPAPQLGSRALFPTLKARSYVNHAGISPPSTVVTRAVSGMLKRYAEEGTGAVFYYRKVMEGLRIRLGRLLGTSAENIAFTTNTSQGVISIALCLPWRPNASIVCFDGEFPTNVTPWQQAAARYDLNLKMLPLAPYATDESHALETLEKVLAQEDVQLVAVSSVQFQTGLRMPLEAMTRLCHQYGTEIFVDAIQTAGVMPTDLSKLGVDYATGGGHKWLMGLEGTGWLYAHPDRVSSLRPHVVGWLSHEDAISFLFRGEGHLQYDRPICKQINFIEAGMPNIAGLVSLDASTQLIEQLGIPGIWQHITEFLRELESGLVQRGFMSLRSNSPANQSSILSVKAPMGVSTLQLAQDLEGKGIVCGIPDGKLRFSPHWPNNLEEVGVILEAVDECLSHATQETNHITNQPHTDNQ